jgi:hypothetical protein
VEYIGRGVNHNTFSQYLDPQLHNNEKTATASLKMAIEGRNMMEYHTDTKLQSFHSHAVVGIDTVNKFTARNSDNFKYLTRPCRLRMSGVVPPFPIVNHGWRLAALPCTHINTTPRCYLL